MLIIDCPSCFARFRVPLGVVPPEGRNFRCSACGHIWHYTDPFESRWGESVVPTADPATEIPHFQDVIREVIHASDSAHTVPSAPEFSRGIGNWGPCAAGYMTSVIISVGVLWGLVLAQTTLTAIVPRLAVVYQLFGIYTPPTEPLVFRDVTLDRDDSHITIKGQIENKTERQRNAPSIRAVLVTGEQDQKPEVWVFRTGKTFVDVKSKGEMVPFSMTGLTNQASKVTAVRLEFVEVQ